MSALDFAINYLRNEVGDTASADEAAAELARLQAIEAAAREALTKIVERCEAAGLIDIALNDPVQMAVYLSLWQAKSALAALDRPAAGE